MTSSVTRRAILGAIAASPFAFKASALSKIPVGLELYSVRDQLKADPAGTLQAVAKEGYSCVEFFSPYYDWTPEHAREVRKQLDDLNLRCYSTHNGRKSFAPEGMAHAIELNKILGTKYIVLAHPGKEPTTADGWKQIADMLDSADHTMQSEGLHAGYHNHDLEWKPVDGQRPLEIIAKNTNSAIMLQLDVGTCIATGNDPVAWINEHPGRIRSLHLKDWSADGGYRVLFGQGSAPWKQIFAAAEKTGGVEYYLIEQEGSQFPEMETAARCLVAFNEIHG
jgi:sugar phosphate isomerase/epimerase